MDAAAARVEVPPAPAPAREAPGPRADAAAALQAVGLAPPSPQARGTMQQALRDVERVRAAGAPTPAGLPDTVQVPVPLGHATEYIQVHCVRQGEWKDVPGSKRPHPTYNLRFQTHVLGLSNEVYCSLILSLDPSLPSALPAVHKTVQAHVQAVARAGPDRLDQVPNHYTARAGQKGELSIQADWPGGRYEGRTVESYTKTRELRPGEIRAHSDEDLEIRLSSGQTIRSTRVRLQKARELAGRITFVVNPDGSRVKAGADPIEKVAQRLAAFSVQDLEALERAGYRVMLVDRNRKPRGGYPGGRPGREVNQDGTWQAGTDAYCSYGEKVITIPIDSLDKVGGGGSDDLLHEMAHALSDSKVADRGRLFGNPALSLDDSPAVTAGWTAYRKRCGWAGKGKPLGNPSAVWSGYALTGPQEYFAEGVSFYKQGGRSRAVLKEKDPGFFAYLEGMFRGPG